MIEQPLSSSAEAQVRALIQQRQKIEAITLVRQHTGLGLKEAKDRVDAMERELGLPVSGPGPGAGLLIAAVVIISGLLAWWWLL